MRYYRSVSPYFCLHLPKISTMYALIRPLLFKFQPETIHHLTINALRISGMIPGGKTFLRLCFKKSHPHLHRNFLGIDFPNPVGMAAGFDKNAEAFNELGALGFGFVEIGTVTPLAQPGNPKPRCFRLIDDQAIINRMGLNNKGVEDAACRLKRRKRRIIVGGNLGKNTLTSNDQAAIDYDIDFVTLYNHVDYFVVNVSCPNISSLRDLQESNSLKDILTRLSIRRQVMDKYKPILVKISPDLSFDQIDNIIHLVRETGMDGVVAVNTTTSREGLKTNQDRITEIANGGLSGAPLTKRAIEIVKYIHKKTEGHLPIIGVGGIMSIEDALNMLDAGASLIQIYSGLIYNGPGFIKRICKAILRRESGHHG